MVLLGAFLDKINVKSEENAMKNRVKELREAKHLTQTGLALKVGSTQQTISKIEREIGVPKLDLALIMADFFNVTLEYRRLVYVLLFLVFTSALGVILDANRLAFIVSLLFLETL